MSNKFSGWIAGLVCVFWLSGSAWGSEKVTVYAASSLTNALQDIARQYQQQQPGKIAFSFASSSTLARQIEQGAPADIFVSADQRWMNYLDQRGKIEKPSRYVLTGNTLVLIAPADSQTPIIDINPQTKWETLLKGQRLAIGDPAYVPAGIYAREALQHAGGWNAIAGELAPANSVRAALALVERGETPFGIVYGSDAVVSQKVRVVGIFPASSFSAIEYPAAIIKGRGRAEVHEFLKYMRGEEAKRILQHYGFKPLP